MRRGETASLFLSCDTMVDVYTAFGRAARSLAAECEAAALPAGDPSAAITLERCAALDAACCAGLGLKAGAPLPAGFDGETPWSVVVLGAAHGGKAVDRAVLEAVIAATPGRVVLVGGEAERALGAALPGESWAGATSVAESAALLRGARAVLAGDTGMMHLAAALGRPVVAVWGCTRPSLGIAAWRPAPGSANVLPVGLGDLRPCSKLGNRCRYRRDPGCSRHIRPEEVVAAWRNALS